MKKTTTKKTAKATAKAADAKEVTAEIVPIDLPSANLETEVDLKLSKQDLVEMVVEDTRDILEGQLKDAEVKRDELQKAFETKLRQLPAILSKDFENKFKKEIEEAKKFVGPKAKASINARDRGGNGDAYLLEDGSLLSRKEVNTLCNEKGLRGITNKYYGETPNRKDYLSVVSLNSTVSFSVSSKEDQEYDYDEDEYKNQTHRQKQVSITHTYKVNELKKMLDLEGDQVKTLNAQKNLCVELQTKLSELNGMGKKIKANLTRQILGSTKDGKSVVSSIDAIKASLNDTLAISFTKK